MKKILVIPPQPYSPRLKVRLVEIAKLLSAKFDVYLVYWTVDLENYSLTGRLRSCIADLFRGVNIVKQDNLRIVEFPMLHRPLCLVPAFNSFWLKMLVNREKIDVVMNGSYYLFSIPQARSFRYMVDLADLPAEGTATHFDRFIYKQTESELKKADAVTVVSRNLAKYVADKYKLNAYPIPNGAYVDQLRSLSVNNADEVKKELGLEGKWVIGYIGFIGPWVDVEFLVSVFREVKKEITNAALLLVGASPRLDYFRKELSGTDIVFTGGIEGDINKYFNCLDLGVLPHKKNLFQDMAFHIKIIEYTASRKMVVSSPLNEVLEINFSNIAASPMEKMLWAGEIRKAYRRKWEPSWDNQVYEYDWQNIINKLAEIIHRVSN